MTFYYLVLNWDGVYCCCAYRNSIGDHLSELDDLNASRGRIIYINVPESCVRKTLDVMPADYCVRWPLPFPKQ